MYSFEKDKLLRIAAHLIVFRNLKARNTIQENNIEAQNLFKLNRGELRTLGFFPHEIERLNQGTKQMAEAEISLAQKNKIAIVFQEDKYFPPLLKEIPVSPDFIYVLGNPETLGSEKLAVVGSRHPTNYGITSLKNILPEVIGQDLTIVSGMANGIDAMAHEITIREGGSTIGVNAGGLLHLYPAAKQPLMGKIQNHGCIISDFPLNIVPRPHHFPIRNRIISGLCKSVLVIEAALKSGSLITARMAVEQNRDVFALPGRIDSSLSRGTNYLIQQGAKLISSSKDILEEYGIMAPPQNQLAAHHFSNKEKKLLDLIGENEVKDIDYFVENLNLPISEIISQLMVLMLKNVIVEDSGGYKKII